MIATLLQIVEIIQKWPLEYLEAIFNYFGSVSCSRYYKDTRNSILFLLPFG